MKGYLQRLAVGVMQPAPVIRPMMGSLFAPAVPAKSPETLPFSETTLASEPAPSIHVAGRREEAEAKDSYSSLAARQASFVAASAFQEASAEPGYAPLMGHVEAQPDASLRPQVSAGEVEALSKAWEKTRPIPSSRGEQDTAVEEGQETRTLPANQTRELVFKHVLLPLVGPSGASSGNDSAGLRGNGAAYGDDPQGSGSRRAGLPIREQDEIQIHIGRIEVTAVQPASAPPAPRTTHKKLSLDEYLRRANGRRS